MTGSLAAASALPFGARADSSPRATDVEADFLALLEACERPLYGYLLRLVRDHDIAQDCAQDTFIRAHRAMHAGQAITRHWLFRVAHNRAVDEFRRGSRVQADLTALEATPVSESTDERLGVQETLDALEPLDREVLHLFVVEGFKTDEIGAMLGMSGGAIRQRLYRARERFRVLHERAA